MSFNTIKALGVEDHNSGTKIRGLGGRSCPQSGPDREDLSTRILSLPMPPFLTIQEIDYIVEGEEKIATHYHK